MGMINLKEMVPFEKSSEVEAGLLKKYKDMPEDTFGIDMEFHTGGTGDFDPWDYLDEWEGYVDESSGYAYRALTDWVDQQRSELNSGWDGEAEDWVNTFGPVDVDTWDNENPEPEREDYSDDEDGEKEFDEAYQKWDEKRSDVDYEWRRFNYTDYSREWIEYLIESDEWENYFDRPEQDDYNEDTERDVDYYIGEVTGGDDGWDVGQDGSDIMEIRTPPLKYTEKNLSLLQDIMEHCSEVASVGGDVSAHIHIGLPNDTTIFDLLSMSTLVDEKAIKKDLSADRDLASWSKLSDELHRKIIDVITSYLRAYRSSTGEIEKLIGKSFDVKNEALSSRIFNMRYYGVNMTSFSKNHTIEFRYFSSQVVSNFEQFKKWIKYFLLLARVGCSRDQFIIGKGEKIPLAFTRKDRNTTTITLLDKNGKLPKKSSYPTKEPAEDDDGEARKEKLKKKLKSLGQKEFPFMRRKSKLP